MRFRYNDRPMFYGADSITFEIASVLRRNMTLPERVLCKQLSNRKLFKTKFRRQHPINIFIVDFYNHEYKLVIEIDGEIHNYIKRKEYDDGREYELERYGLKVIRFTNDQVLNKTDIVIDEILKYIS